MDVEEKMASNGTHATQDEIRQRLEAMTTDELRAVAGEFKLDAPQQRGKLIELLAQDPSVRSYVWIEARQWAKKTRRLDLVGTAAAAAILKVERPRIGRWVSRGTMPQPATWIESGPVWRRADIEAMREEVEARRR